MEASEQESADGPAAMEDDNVMHAEGGHFEQPFVNAPCCRQAQPDYDVAA